MAELDLDSLLPKLQDVDWAAVLAPFAYVRLATLPQLVALTGWPALTLRRTLLAICQTTTGADAILTRDKKQVAHRAWETKGAVVYRLGRVGGALLQQQGLTPKVRAGQERRELAIRQALCILDVVIAAQAAGLALAVEKPLTRPHQTIRPDTAWQDAQGLWHLVEVEQVATENHYGRVLERLQNWQCFFAVAASPPVATDIVVLFNLRLGDMPATLALWQAALAEVGVVPFRIRYAGLWDFLNRPDWAGANYPVLAPSAPRPAPSAATVDPLDDCPADLAGWVQTAWELHQLARPVGQDPIARLGVPVAALRAFRTWLNAPQQERLKTLLAQALGRTKPHTGLGPMVGLLTRLAWGVLQHWGLERDVLGPGGELQILALGPTLDSRESGGYGDYYVRVRLGESLYAALKQAPQLSPEATRARLEEALGWFLTAPYTYAYQLGLRAAPWGESTTPVKRQKQR